MPRSAEYDRIKKATPDLLRAVQGSIIALGSALFAESVISEEIYYSLLNEYRSRSIRAADLGKSVTNKVRLDPEYFYTFVRIFKSECGDVLKDLSILPQSGNYNSTIIILLYLGWLRTRPLPSAAEHLVTRHQRLCMLVIMQCCCHLLC
jgi:hypothetical protein